MREDFKYMEQCVKASEQMAWLRFKNRLLKWLEQLLENADNKAE